ncbi:Fat-free like protein [Termitomyces sp. J132]|nr:hypothetical protein H2248_008480 [Termitomyces sp. 'cryptogamus']KNZ81824.1 Fat-free like protein [Termitomyces sp. J132]
MTSTRRDSGTPRLGSSLNPTSSPVPSTSTTPHANSEHPSARRSSTPSTPPPQKSRARDLLRKHYGLGVGPPPPIPGKAANDPMNLDSTAFDAKSYYEQLITTSSLQSLLKRENELLSEIRELDSERQSLVYNHHHELIAASDTIATMKTRAESLDADLDLLKVAFSEISRISSEVAIEASNSEAEFKRS